MRLNGQLNYWVGREQAKGRSHILNGPKREDGYWKWKIVFLFMTFLVSLNIFSHSPYNVGGCFVRVELKQEVSAHNNKCVARKNFSFWPPFGRMKGKLSDSLLFFPQSTLSEQFEEISAEFLRWKVDVSTQNSWDNSIFDFSSCLEFSMFASCLPEHSNRSHLFSIPRKISDIQFPCLLMWEKKNSARREKIEFHQQPAGANSHSHNLIYCIFIRRKKRVEIEQEIDIFLNQIVSQ